MIAAFSVSPSGTDEVGPSSGRSGSACPRERVAERDQCHVHEREGEWDEVMALIKSCVLRLAEGSPRISVVIKVDYRPGVTGALRGKGRDGRASPGRVGGVGTSALA